MPAIHASIIRNAPLNASLFKEKMNKRETKAMPAIRRQYAKRCFKPMGLSLEVKIVCENNSI